MCNPQLKALLKKNLILMKRNSCATACQILFPVMLMLLLTLVRSLFKITNSNYDPNSDEVYMRTNTNFYNLQLNPNSTKDDLNYSLGLFPIKKVCQNRSRIGIINNSSKNDEIIYYLNKYSMSSFNIDFTTVNYDNLDKLNKDIKEKDSPDICFAFSFTNIKDSTYNYSLHYFDALAISGANADIPNQILPALNPFQYGPDQISFNQYRYSGFLNIMVLINNLILKFETNKTIDLNVAIGPQKYYTIKNDDFSKIVGLILPFFLVMAYVSPLCVLVFNMVSDKESKAKEGMKIMGLTETQYFLSNFIHYICLNTFLAIINSFVLLSVFSYINYFWMFCFFWLYGMSIFSIGYFFQSMMDKTRVAMIVSILLYFIMFFLSAIVYNPNISKLSKIVTSFFPQIALQLGVMVLTKFESASKIFSSSDLFYDSDNFNVGTMYLMLIADFFIFLLLGLYLQNVISQQYGQSKPFYFLCTKKFWCKKNKNVVYLREKADSITRPSKFKDNYQDESQYNDKLNNGECLKLTDIVKVFDDGKVAVDGLSLNIYKDEIFALLGHNGAGKTTLISILCGLYEKTSGQAFHENEDIYENMDEFRKKIGICPQHDVLFDKLTVREHLEMFAIFKGVDPAVMNNDIDKVISDMELNEKENICVQALSGGQKRKLSIGIALLGGSKVVFLDEPSSGMDITSRRALWDILKKCNNNRIIVLTTHYMEEAAILGNRIGIVANGKLKCCGTSLFLINRFGKYISLTIVKDQNCDDQKVINFIKQKIGNNVEFDIFSEEILVRINKDNEFNVNLKEFFNSLDQNITLLDIKSYSASMPTLEDVFLNVSAETKANADEILAFKKNENTDDETIKLKKVDDNLADKLMNLNNYSYDQYERSLEGEVTGTKMFFNHLKACLMKRFLQIIRDKKTFVLEVFCPILLVLTGLIVVSVKLIYDSPPRDMKMNLLPSPQTITINANPLYSRDLDLKAVFKNKSDETYNFVDISNTTSIASLVEFNNRLFLNNNDTKNLAGYFILNTSNSSNQYDAVLLINTVSKDACVIFLQNFFNNMISAISGKQVEINLINTPLPMTKKDQSISDLQGSQNLVFFLTIAFSLIPANFITIIIKEREMNTKHLQIISGISYTSYWITNFIFELVKYLFTGGVCVILMMLFNNYSSEDKNIIVSLYLLNGVGMVSITYLLSFLFVAESTAQNFTILFNYLLGPLSCTIVFVLKISGPSTMTVAKTLSYILSVFPSFSFAYGMNQVLAKNLIQVIDGKDGKEIDILSFEYVGKSIYYLMIFSVIYIISLWIVEFFGSKVLYGSGTIDSPIVNKEEIKDDEVYEEINKANKGDEEINKNYSIRVKNLEKIYGNCLEEKKQAINKLSFCLNYGDCFALLGLNGAGKTTTFKCLTSEIFPSNGKIYINNQELQNNFDSVRKLIGYCPQFDAIFDYLTVQENLAFYANIKGIPDHLKLPIIKSLLEEMHLMEYKNKISGNLSGGNKRKLSVAIAMIGNPPIILLDEPSTGVDPEARRFMWSVIHKISVKRKHSTVILTTHSMEEAETLCKKIGIMIKGQFRCLGTSQSIKSKYGYGYEIDLRIHNPEISDKEFQDVILNKENINEYLMKLGKNKFSQIITDEGLGSKIYEELYIKNQCTVKKLKNWIFITQNILKLCSNLKSLFPEIFISEFYENNFKIKLKKSENFYFSIGSLFGHLENYKNDFHISEYGISQTSLEQIFNKFANEDNFRSENQNSKREILITENLTSLLD